MSSIGGHSVISAKGAINPQGERLEDTTRPGVDGVSYRRIGKKSESFQLRTFTDAASAAAAKALVATTYKGLQGTLVTVVDDMGNTWNNVAVLAVDPVSVKGVNTPVGGVVGGVVLLECLWTLQATET